MTKYYFSCLMATTFFFVNPVSSFADTGLSTGAAAIGTDATPFQEYEKYEKMVKVYESRQDFSYIEIAAPEGEERLMRGLNVDHNAQSKVDHLIIHNADIGLNVATGSRDNGSFVWANNVTIYDVKDGISLAGGATDRGRGASEIYVTDFNIEADRRGLIVMADATAYMTNGTIVSHGGYAITLNGQSGGQSKAVLDNVQAIGDNQGAYINEGNLTLTNGSSITAKSTGIFVGMNDTLNGDHEANISLTDSAIVAGHIGMRISSGRPVYTTLDNSSITGQWLYQMFSVKAGYTGMLDLQATNGTVLRGAGYVEKGEGNTVNVTLSDNSSWYLNDDTNVTNLKLDGTSQIVFEKNELTNVRLDGFVHMTVNNDYVSDNGLIVFNADLNTNNEDSPRDHLLIEGKAEGQTRVAVNNRSGLGGLTDKDGINLITVNGGLGDNGAGTFVMDGDYLHNGEVVVAGGAYIYGLEHNKAANGEDEWNLHSVFEGEGNGGEDGGGGEAVYGAGVPLYEAYAQVLQRMNSLSTMQQRVGGRRFVGDNNGSDNRGFWMRVEGSTGHFNAARSTSRTNYDLDTVKTQMGLDFDVLETESGQLVGGVYVQYGHGKADVFSRYGRGDIKVDAYGFGGTLTWQGNNGFYIDGQAQMQWFDSSLYSRSRNGENGFDKHLTTGNDGMGYALSLESGRAFALGNGWQMTPQAQLTYSRIDFDSFHDLVNAHIKSDDGDSLIGRLGLSVEHTRSWQAAAGDNRAVKFYGIGNLYQEFLDGTSVKVSGVDFRNRADRTWAGIGAGVDYSWKDGAFALYGEVNAATSFKDFGDSYNLQGTIGFKAKF